MRMKGNCWSPVPRCDGAPYEKRDRAVMHCGVFQMLGTNHVPLQISAIITIKETRLDKHYPQFATPSKQQRII
jgi:hypothetical protein